MPTVASVIVGIIGFLMRRSIAEMDKKIDDMGKKMDQSNARMEQKLDQSNARLEQSLGELRKEFYDYRDKAAEEFVRKTDFILATSDIGKKLDKVYDILLDMKGRGH